MSWKTPQELDALEKQGFTCKACKFYPCSSTAEENPLPLCFDFEQKIIAFKTVIDKELK